MTEALDIAKEAVNLYNQCIFEVAEHKIYAY